METNLPILRQENVQLIAHNAPEAFNSNALSSQKCSDFGQSLLAEILRSGMNDDLDQRAAVYIEKARRTVKAMNERRAPFTKLFDQIRSEFTAMENSIDPTKKGTVPYEIQQIRNNFATRKREEAERARQEELRRQHREQTIAKYRTAVEDDIRGQFDALVRRSLDFLSGLNAALSLENHSQTLTRLKAYPVELDSHWITSAHPRVLKPVEVNDKMAFDILKEIKDRIAPALCQQYRTEIGEYRDSILEQLPSKHRDLQLMAKADAEQQERMKKELAEREAASLKALEEERRRKEEEAKAAKAVQQSASEMDGLFAQTAVAAPAAYQPKTAVKQKIVPTSPEGILAIVSFWWSKEGQFLSVEELSKIFKKQITFCERVANDKNNPEFISSIAVRYEEEVKAK